MSHRQLAGNSTIVLAEPIDGECRDSVNNNYPRVGIVPVPDNPVGNATALRDWCKSWCDRVDPDKVVAIEIDYDSYNTRCRCLFSADDLPTGAANSDAFKAKYDPNATAYNDVGTGIGCIAGPGSAASYLKCYRNCAYGADNQCASIYACLS